MRSNKHRVLLFGEKVFGSAKPKLSVDYAEVDLLCFPGEYNKLTRLANYDLVILDYSAFMVEGSLRKREQDVFSKQMVEALDKGTYFCFLHFDEAVPRQDGLNWDDGHMDKDGIRICRKTQIGFRWLPELNIRPFCIKSPVLSSKAERNEFKVYQERWGASENVFRPYGKGKFDDVIISSGGGYVLGFGISARSGKLLYLPCQRDFNRPEDVTECLNTLINNTITYMTRSSTSVPAWAETPLFTKEKEIQSRLTHLESELQSSRSQLEPFREAKALAFASEYEFQERVPTFFETHLGLHTERHEEFKEDFWILDSERKRIVIAETKSCVRGFKKKTAIYSLYAHRDSAGLAEDFPAIMVINAHLNAKSWKEKVRPIDRQDYECAAENNILLLRMEDLLFFWNSIVEGRPSSDELLSLLKNHKGWMEVKMDGSVIFHP